MDNSSDNILSPRSQTRGVVGAFDATAIARPVPALHRYYLIVSAFSLLLFPVIYIPLLIRYQTMRYRFDDAGVSMSWGYFFRKEFI
jgi:putative membrane protein